MEYRSFGKTDIKVSAIGFGCWEVADRQQHLVLTPPRPMAVPPGWLEE